jgi:hypothetical protein
MNGLPAFMKNTKTELIAAKEVNNKTNNQAKTETQPIDGTI